MLVNGTHYRTVWLEGTTVKAIDQLRLPHRFEIATLATYRDTAEAIRTMLVRGAGAIGVAAGFGMAQAVLTAPAGGGFLRAVEEAAALLRATRPTAQNLFYAVERVLGAVRPLAAQPEKARRLSPGEEATPRAPARRLSLDEEATPRAPARRLSPGEEVPLRGSRKMTSAEGTTPHAQAWQRAVAEAQAIADEDAAAGEAIGRFGETLLPDRARVLTHCNAGWLAFADWGTALAPVYTAARKGRRPFVYVDETRPRGQGAKLTAWELAQEGVEHALIADVAAGSLMHRREVDLVIVGADRIAANGDVANKIGTFSLAVLARAHQVPFYVAAPTSTIDTACPSGDRIPIEERSAEEVTHVTGLTADGREVAVRVAPEGCAVRNPAFDVTPAEYVSSLITERGIVPATSDGIRRVCAHV